MSASSDELERRLERRIVGMADRLWKKVLETSEQVQDLQAELWRVHEEVQKVGGIVTEQATSLQETVDKGMLEARLEEVRSWTQQRFDGQASQLDGVHAAVQKLVQAEASTHDELQSVRDASKEATEELFGHVASAEEHMQQLRGRLGASEERLEALQVHLDAGLEASKVGLEAFKAGLVEATEATSSVRSRHEELRAEVDQLRTGLENQAVDVATGFADVKKVAKQQGQATQDLKKTQQEAHQQVEGLLLKLSATDAEQQQVVGKLQLELGSLQKACEALPLQLVDLQGMLGKLDKELAWMRGLPAGAEDASSLAFPQRYEALEKKVGKLHESVDRGHSEQKEVCALLQQLEQRLEQSAEGLSQRLEQQGTASEKKTEQLFLQHGSLACLANELQETAKRLGEQLGKDQAALQVVNGQVQELSQRQQSASQQLSEQLRRDSERLEATLVDTERRLLSKAEEVAADASKGLGELQERAARGEAALEAGLQSLTSRTQKHEVESLVALKEAAGRLDAVEALRPQLGEIELRTATCERRLHASEAWQGACSQWQSAQEERHNAHTKGLQLLTEQCQEVFRHVDAKVAEVRAAAKEDLAASALNSFQGELKLWAKLAQMSGRPGLPQELLQAAVSLPCPESQPFPGYGPPHQGVPVGATRTASPRTFPRAP